MKETAIKRSGAGDKLKGFWHWMGEADNPFLPFAEV
jgi:hypothetical protein